MEENFEGKGGGESSSGGGGGGGKCLFCPPPLCQMKPWVQAKEYYVVSGYCD